MNFLRRTVWIIKTLPLTLLIGGPAILLHLVWCGLAWVVLGRDTFFDDETPLGWITTGWRLKIALWPLPDSGDV